MLFHARVAAEDPDLPFGIDEVATGLVDKARRAAPHVFAAGEQVATAADQDRRWDELKRAEQRDSSVNGVATAQPAVALAAARVPHREAFARPTCYRGGDDAGAPVPAGRSDPARRETRRPGCEPGRPRVHCAAVRSREGRRRGREGPARAHRRRLAPVLWQAP
ncbi:hypothetical protein HBB16_14890 [Pseudonocardia sp. MCCB 268]|nr:hypothetical protein [Pseudonocardia cytotoxica]